MKRIFSCFLLQKQPARELSAGKRAVFWAWNWVLLIGACTVLGLGCLGLAPGLHSWVLFLDYLSHPGILVLNLIPVILLGILGYGISGRAWIGYLVSAVPMLALAVGNFYKLAFRDDPVVAADLLILGEAGKMAGNYKLFFNGKVAIVLAAAVLSTVLLALLARGVPKRWWSRAAIALIPVIAAAALYPTYRSDAVYAKNANEEHINRWVATQQYTSRGLIYPFIHSIKDAVRNPPEGYSQKEVNSILSQYTSADIPEDKKVNVVSVMLEAFCDFSLFDEVELRQDFYADYHALEAESYTGNLLTNIFAGGTAHSERAFLTGISSGDHNFRGPTSSYVWYLRSQGYHTSGDHPSSAWFYNRVNINEYMGFQEYRFMSNWYDRFSSDSVAYDDVFFPELTRSILEQLASDEPLFSFSVNYQGHGPYASEGCMGGDVNRFVGNEGISEESRNILANYLLTVQDTQRHLMGLVDALRESEEPVVLVLFGDHKPWLGNSNSVYNELGIQLSGDSREAVYNYWSTRYLIWANDAAKEALGNDFTGTGPDISPCFLMNLLFEQCGWEGDAYTQAAADCMAVLPVISTNGFYLTADGTLTRSLNEEQQAIAHRYALLEYDRSTRYQYGKE
ncbi:MAG: sulfatase-like hydrolase/transferase [Oscillospiraceae bacterium]|nr:sulfatase-like hydrolase/transferase [Oscillospiraceae bacterium]